MTLKGVTIKPGPKHVPGGLAAGMEVLDSEGRPIPNVFRIVVDPIVPDQPIRASVEVWCSSLEFQARSTVVEVCPACQARRDVTKLLPGESYGEAEVTRMESPDLVREFVPTAPEPSKD